MLCSACGPQHQLQHTRGLPDALRCSCKHLFADIKGCKQCRQQCAASLIRHEHHWGCELVGRHLSRGVRHMHDGQDCAARPWKWAAQRMESLSLVQSQMQAEMTREACMHSWQCGNQGRCRAEPCRVGRVRVLGHDAGHALTWLAHFQVQPLADAETRKCRDTREHACQGKSQERGQG